MYLSLHNPCRNGSLLQRDARIARQGHPATRTQPYFVGISYVPADNLHFHSALATHIYRVNSVNT